MSQQFKINSTLLSIICSALGAWGTVSWIASSKASDIESHAQAIHKVKEDIELLKASERTANALLQRLDERTTLILETVRKK
jgi:hypothetical protein